MTKPLDTQMREFLEETRGEWPALAKQSGVSYSWLTKFATDRIPTPRYATLMKLHLARANARKRAK